MYNMINIVATALCYIWKLLRDEILRVLSARTEKKKIFLEFCTCVILWIFTKFTMTIIS